MLSVNTLVYVTLMFIVWINVCTTSLNVHATNVAATKNKDGVDAVSHFERLSLTILNYFFYYVNKCFVISIKYIFTFYFSSMNTKPVLISDELVLTQL